MKRDLNRFSQIQYDVLIVGGGINGAAVANVATLNGLKTALIEKGDFSSGTSSKSTKLIHGGFRYLENLDFGLVKESLRERHIQLNSAPHLVKPIGFVIPVYKGDKRPFWMMKLGAWLYDRLSKGMAVHPYQTLTPAKVKETVEGIEEKDLVGGVMYYDAQMDDARLVLENVLQADAQGAHVANYVEAKSLIKENGKTVGVIARDILNEGTFEIRAKKVVCAVGPWTNVFMNHKERGLTPPKIRTTKGVHIVYKGQCSEHAVFIQSKRDKRILFVIPWMGNSLIGTTDTDYQGHPDDCGVLQEDVDYLLEEAGRLFPQTKFDPDNIITTFSGLRPLIFEEGDPRKISRKHEIQDSFSKIQYIMGGKYTTYRKIAEDSVRRITNKKLLDTSEQIPLYGAGELPEDLVEVAQNYQIEESIVQALIDLYGARYIDILDLCREDSSLKEILCGQPLVIKAQVKYAKEVEMVQTFEDLISRRLPLQYTGANTTAIADYFHAEM